MFMDTIDLGQSHRKSEYKWVYKSSEILTKSTKQLEKDHKQMNENTRIDKTIQLYHENIVNLLDAVQCAGGSVTVVSKDMPLGDFLNTCAKNGVKISARHEPLNTDKDDLV